MTPEQMEFGFSDVPPEAPGPPPWRTEWMRRAKDVCQLLGVPLHHHVEVWLAQGPVLRGRLCLDEEQLWPDGDRHRLKLRIGHAAFCLGEMESVVRLDEPSVTVDQVRKMPAAESGAHAEEGSRSPG